MKKNSKHIITFSIIEATTFAIASSNTVLSETDTRPTNVGIAKLNSVLPPFTGVF